MRGGGGGGGAETYFSPEIQYPGGPPVETLNLMVVEDDIVAVKALQRNFLGLRTIALSDR